MNQNVGITLEYIHNITRDRIEIEGALWEFIGFMWGTTEIRSRVEIEDCSIMIVICIGFIVGQQITKEGSRFDKQVGITTIGW